jgi:hypothetical protein
VTVKRTTQAKYIQANVKKISSNIYVYILGLFIVSRLIYISLGDITLRIFNQYIPSSSMAYQDKISSHIPIQMWYVWDAVHYGNLAKLYNFSLSKLPVDHTVAGKSSYYLLHWFPLYPVTGKLLNLITHISIPYSLIIVSNLAFLISLILIYKLVMTDDKDNKLARRIVAVMILLPTSFIFSAALSESMFLALALAAIYSARKQKWIFAGVFGFLLALTRSEGFLIAIPLIVEAIQQYGVKPIKLKNYVKPFIACLTTVLGLAVFMIYCWARTKNAFAYVDSAKIGGEVTLGDPFYYLLHNLFKLRTLIVLAEAALIALAWKKLRWSYIAFSIIYVLIAFSIANGAVASMLRYTSFLFPVAIAVGYLMKRQSLANYLWVGLGILNGALFILWVNWWTGFII